MIKETKAIKNMNLSCFKKILTLIKSQLKNIKGVSRSWREWTMIRPFLYHRLIGSPIPPEHGVKLYWLSRYQRAYSLKILIETGIYRGKTVTKMLDRFDHIYTIEIGYDLWDHAHKKFSPQPHVHVIWGNSGDVLPILLRTINNRCLFWLDGHYSGVGTTRGHLDTPIVDELEAISSHHRKDHIILIDDARLFSGENGYPTIKTVRSLLKSINSDYTIHVVDDIIQARLPSQS